MAAASAVAAVAIPRAMRAGACSRRLSSSSTTLAHPARVPSRPPPPIALAPTLVASRARAASLSPRRDSFDPERRSPRRRARPSRVPAIDVRDARPTGPTVLDRAAPHRR
jgi:hypothetical protein